jgi:hypothetical protein
MGSPDLDTGEEDRAAAAARPARASEADSTRKRGCGAKSLTPT